MNYIPSYVMSFLKLILRTLRYLGFVEPLLDKNIYTLINYARNKLSKSNIEMVTNGDVLNKRLVKLLNQVCQNY